MRPLDAFFATRPLLLIPAWSFFLLGAGGDASSAFPARSLLLLSLILMATHLLNQVVDQENDRLNNKGFFLQQGIFTPKQYVTTAAVLLSGALGIAWSGGEGAVLLSLAAFLGLAYNLQPLKLSHRPFADLVANAVGYGGVAFLLGQGVSLREIFGYPLLATTCSVGAVFLHTTLLDLEGDRHDGKTTTGVRLGKRRTRIVAAALATAALMAAGVTKMPELMGPCALLALLTWFAGSQRVSVWGTAVFAVTAAIAFWWFGLALGLLVLCTRIFYARRFGLRYPSF